MFKEEYQDLVVQFFETCMLDLGRKLDLSKKHKGLLDISNNFEKFWCLFDGEKIIGTVGVRKLNESSCELKSLYLRKEYQGKGYGFKLLTTTLEYSKNTRYKDIYLDTLSTSTNALKLYHRTGFIETKRYNDNQTADVFMKLKLN